MPCICLSFHIGREQIHKEQLKYQRRSVVVEERGRQIQELKKNLQDSEKTVEELSERIKEFESPCSESDDIVACCSSMKELLQLKMELVEKDEIIKEIQKNNPQEVLENAIISAQGWKAKEKREKVESDQHNQLKLKFLRDAFFYFMIDFHSEEQMKAILAVLSYGDQREDVIYQAYRMRQRGKKFAVKEVSSRGLAFLHEES
jgi:Fe2+ transport system protein B